MLQPRRRQWPGVSCIFHVVGALFAFTGASAFTTQPNIFSPHKQMRRAVVPGSKIRDVACESSIAAIDADSLNKELQRCNSGNAARKVVERVLTSGSNVDGAGDSSLLYGSITIPRGASDRGLSDGDLAIQTKIRNKKYGIMDLIELNGDRDADRASLALFGIFVGSTGSALVANQNLPGPEILRFLVVWLFSFAPLAFVGYGLVTPEKLQTLLISLQRNFFPTYRKRMIQHEAGHFLLGHLLGLSIKGYTANAVKNAVEFYPLNDPDAGRDRARMLGFDIKKDDTSERDDFEVAKSERPYFSKEGRGGDAMANQSVFRASKNYRDNPFLKLPSQNEPTKAWPYRGFDHDMIDQLAVISVAGVCSEILAFGNAEGGYADFSQLRQLFNRAEPELSERDMDNRIRFALGYTMSLLRVHLGALDALADVMEKDGTVAECILALETCSNVSGEDGVMGDYERRRRDLLRSQGVGVFERFLLGEKTADVEENSFVEGKGGGYRRKRFALTGDDPFYIAVALATAFFVWASGGGLSLH